MQFNNEKNFITKLIADTFILKFHIFIDTSSVYTHRHMLSVKLSYNIYINTIPNTIRFCVRGSGDDLT